MRRLMHGCPAERTARLLGGRWTILILDALFRGRTRFLALQRALAQTTGAALSAKVLTHELRALEAEGLVRRDEHPEVPPRVEYALTPLGRALHPVVVAMAAWGARQQAEVYGTAAPCTVPPVSGPEF